MVRRFPTCRLVRVFGREASLAPGDHRRRSWLEEAPAAPDGGRAAIWALDSRKDDSRTAPGSAAGQPSGQRRGMQPDSHFWDNAP